VSPKRALTDYQGYGDYDENSPPFHHGWREAEHEEGVAYVCPWEDPYAGFPEHSRRCARALDDAGMRVHLRSVDPSLQWHMYFEVGGAGKGELREKYNDLLGNTFKKLLVEIYQIVPNDELLQKLTTSRWIDAKQLEAVNRFRVISCVFERDRISDFAAKALNRVGMVWVANSKDKTMLERCGVERVAVVPIPHFPDDPLLKMQGKPRRPGPVRFYHIGKWEARKAHHEMLGVFLMAFKPGDARLNFKTSTKAPDFGDYPSGPARSIHKWMEHESVAANGWTVELANQDIHFIRQRVSAKQIQLLHDMGDVYVSLSRGEGFDMPCYDAKLAGNRLVFTPSGGPQDYATVGGDLMVVADGDVPCHPFYRWGDARYLDWRYDDAIEALRHARERVLSGKYTDSDLVPPGFTAKEVGQKMRRLIDEVVERGRKLSEA
jgi:hypothetical protein